MSVPPVYSGSGLPISCTINLTPYQKARAYPPKMHTHVTADPRAVSSPRLMPLRLAGIKQASYL